MSDKYSNKLQGFLLILAVPAIVGLTLGIGALVALIAG